MKVLVISSLPTTTIRARAEQVANKGIDTLLIYPKTDVHPKMTVFNPKANPLSEFFAIRKKFIEFGPDIVHIHFAGGPYPVFAMLVSGKPLLVSTMGADILPDEQPHPTLSSKWLSRWILRSAGYLTAKSDFMLETMEKRHLSDGIPAKKLLWGVDSSKFRTGIDTKNLREKLGIPDGFRTVFSPRKLEPLYNIDKIVKAFASVSEDNKDIRLLLSNDGGYPAYREEIKRLIDSLAIRDRVIWFDYIENSRMPEFYNLSSVVVSVPDSDGLPQTFFEAALCRTTMITSRLPRYREVLKENHDALMCDPHETGELEAAMRLALGETPEIEKIRQNAYENFKRFDLENETKKVVALYEEILHTELKKPTLLQKTALILLLSAHYLEVLAGKLNVFRNQKR